MANVHALLATADNADGHGEILGVDVTFGEDGAGSLAFPATGLPGGLTGTLLVVRACWIRRLVSLLVSYAGVVRSVTTGSDGWWVFIAA